MENEKENIVDIAEIPDADDMKYNVILQPGCQDLPMLASRLENLLPFTEDIKMCMQHFKAKYNNKCRDGKSGEDLSLELKRGVKKAKWVNRELFLIFDQLIQYTED